MSRIRRRRARMRRLDRGGWRELVSLRSASRGAEPYAVRRMARDAIVIAGGGVSGAVLAALLARAGREVIVVERRREDETKCCGCCLAPRGVRRLEALGLADALSTAAILPTRQWRLRGAAGALLFDESLGASPGAVVSRSRFDTALLELARRAGARVLRGATAQLTNEGVVAIRPRGEGGATAPVRSGDAAVLRAKSDSAMERLRPWLLVGADGVGSGVARSAELAPSPPRAWGTTAPRRLGISWRVDATTANSLAIDAESIEIHLVRHGYLGFVHGADGLRAGALALLSPTRGTSGPFARTTQRGDSPSWRGTLSHGDDSRGRGDALASMIDAWAAASPELAALEGCDPTREEDFAATGPLPWRPRRVARASAAPRPGVALVGDAAGYEEPFTGEGMTWAIESAALLASAIEQSAARSRAAAAWDDRAASAYERGHARAFALRRLRLRAVARIGASAARSPASAQCLRWASRVPILPGAIVRSVVAA